MTSYLLTRGIWLVILEVTVVRLGWVPDIGYHFTVLQVIWAIGWSMIFLAGLVFLPPWVVGAVGIFLIGAHNLLDGPDARGLDPGWREALPTTDYELRITDYGRRTK